MSKCFEAFKAHYAGQLVSPFAWDDWQAAWNSRGKVDAEICRDWGNARKDNYGGNALRNCAEAIEKENEQ